MLRECKRCLTYEQADEKTRQSFEMLINGIPKNERTSDKVYDERLTQCESCDSLLAGTCRACGCFVELRAAMKSSKCPHRLWDK
ncbi:MAG: DUF6171 family protein [Lachnospiraceae bacterium]|nr:DUF6171 family protein [Lachnospiraceae bacterium]